MFDPSFFSFGNGLFYNPITDSVFTPESAPASTGKVKGRDYSLSDYENLKYEIGNQTNILGVDHRASFSKNQDEIIDDMAKQLASYGVSSLKDLTQNVYTVEERDPNYFDDGEAPVVTVEKKDVINSKTGEVIPLNKLNNSAGSGFTWYNIDFVDGQAVPYAWKEATGAGALGDQIQSIVAIPPVAAALTAGLKGFLEPSMIDFASSVLPDGVSQAAVNKVGSALANAAATTTTVSAATGDLGLGLKAGGSVILQAGLNEAQGQAVKAFENATGLDLSLPKPTGSLLDVGGDATDYGFLSDTPPVTPVAPPSTEFNYDVEAQAGGFYGNTPTAEFDPRLGGTYITQGGKDVFIPSAPIVETSIQPAELAITAAAPSLLNTVSGPVFSSLLSADTTPTQTIIGTKPTSTDLVAPVVSATNLGDVTITANRPDLGVINVSGTRPGETLTFTPGTTEAPPTFTQTATLPTTIDLLSPVTAVTSITPPETTPPPKTPETPPETPETPLTPVIPNIPVELQQEAQRMGYVPYGSVSYEPLLSLLAPQLMTLPYASAYRRGLL